MNIRGENFDITDIRMGHESDSFATWYVGQQAEKLASKQPVHIAYDAYIEGFDASIRFLANYLKEYGLTIELHDKEVPTHGGPDMWYSGTIIKHKNGER